MENFDYGVVGNCTSAVLISKVGSIDWGCLPAFNAPSVFAKILDKKKGGSFEILVGPEYKITQKYSYRTNILETRFSNGLHIFEVSDFMPRYQDGHGRYYAPPDIIRHFKLIAGNPVFRIKYDPKLEYAKFDTRTSIHKKYIKSITKGGTYDSIYLYTNLDKQQVVTGEDIRLTEDSFFLLSYNQKLLEQTSWRTYLKLERTRVYWLNWSERSVSFRKYNDEIMRSALVLKLMSYDKSGAILAALTTSLPETIGGGRNWDYRFCWIRDASMVVKIMTSLGHRNIVNRYMRFIIDILPDKNEKIQIMYGLDRERRLTETTLSHLEGYEGSVPVRIGNAAFRQKQHDIYGILMDAIYQHFMVFENSPENSEALWTITRSIVKTVEKNWRKKDRGIWEIRKEPKHFTFSKVLCWVAVDRAISLARLINMQEYVKRWEKLKNRIREDVIMNAWNEEIGAFTQAYGSGDLDAANLLMEPYGFIRAQDEKYIKTVRAIESNLMKDGLVYRYRNMDDHGIPTSSFTICTFWLINSLFSIGEHEKADKMFDQLLKYSNHLGLFSEDLDVESKRLLGNFPQAYSHLALIETAINLTKGQVTQDEKILGAIQ